MTKNEKMKGLEVHKLASFQIFLQATAGLFSLLSVVLASFFTKQGSFDEMSLFECLIKALKVFISNDFTKQALFCKKRSSKN